MERCSAATLGRHGLLLSYCRLHCSAISSAFSASGLHGAEGVGANSRIHDADEHSPEPRADAQAPSVGVPRHCRARRPPIAVGGFRHRPVHPAAARVGWRNGAKSRRMAGRQDGRTLPARAGRRAGVKPSSRSAVRRRTGHRDSFVRARHPFHVGGRPDRPSIARPHLRSIADRGLRCNRTGPLGTVAERARVRYVADERSAEDSRPSDHHDQHGRRVRRAAAPDVLAADTRRGAGDAPRLGRRAAFHQGRSRTGRDRDAIQLELAHRMVEGIDGMRVIRAYGREPYEQSRFDVASDRLRQAILRMGTSRAPSIRCTNPC